MAVTDERRLHKRYLVEDGILAALGRNNPILGKIIDISKGGLSFSYKSRRPEGRKSNKLSDLVIFFDDTSLNFNKGPFKFQSEIISDAVFSEEIAIGSSAVRRCGIRFKALTFYRKSWLDYFIRHHSVSVK